MSPSRTLWLSIVATTLLGSAGCRTAGVDNLARRELFPNRTNEDAKELLVEHNLNAEKVVSLEAQPSITFSNRRLVGGAVSGRLAMERPKNFSLRLSDPLSEVADIGSNSDEFWFWIKNSPEKHVFYCNYDESGETPLSTSIDPDWIIEALGLRIVSDAEAARIQVSPGKEIGTLVLTVKNISKSGEVVWKETVLSEATHRIKEHRIFAADHKVVLARAIVTDYQDYPLTTDSGAPNSTVFLPSKIKLQWTQQEKMGLDVALSKVKVNRTISEVRRNELFKEPKLADFPRKNLGEMAGVVNNRSTAAQVPKLDSPTSVRETMPAPPPRVRLSEPAPLGLDGAKRIPRDPTRIAADLSPAYARGVEEVVDPQIPTVAEPRPSALAAQSGWKNSLSAGMER